VAQALSNLAALYCLQGRLEEAEPLFRRALPVAETALGLENPLVGRILTEYAVLLRKSKRKDHAKSLEERAQAIRKRYAREDLARYTIDVNSLRRTTR
jgi:tetratricopeptide (TPR) repeat protein